MVIEGWFGPFESLQTLLNCREGFRRFKLLLEAHAVLSALEKMNVNMMNV